MLRQIYRKVLVCHEEWIRILLGHIRLPLELVLDHRVEKRDVGLHMDSEVVKGRNYMSSVDQCLLTHHRVRENNHM